MFRTLTLGQLYFRGEVRNTNCTVLRLEIQPCVMSQALCCFDPYRRCTATIPRESLSKASVLHSVVLLSMASIPILLPYSTVQNSTPYSIPMADMALQPIDEAVRRLADTLDAFYVDLKNITIETQFPALPPYVTSALKISELSRR